MHHLISLETDWCGKSLSHGIEINMRNSCSHIPIGKYQVENPNGSTADLLRDRILCLSLLCDLNIVGGGRAAMNDGHEGRLGREREDRMNIENFV
jgi:hypothetical protein